MLPVKTDQKSPAKGKGAFTRAIARFRQARKAARIGLIIDATASRENTWERAQVIQDRMFTNVAGLRCLSLRLIHFGGNELTDHGWQDSPRALAARMAGVRCKSGMTQILPALEAFLDVPEEPASAIILIGDAFEEDSDEADHIARLLAQKNIRVFSFLEGDHGTAEIVFKRLAAATCGKFARFGSDLPLADLCEGVALLTSGGAKAVKRLRNAKARQLLLAGPAKR